MKKKTGTTYITLTKEEYTTLVQEISSLREEKGWMLHRIWDLEDTLKGKGKEYEQIRSLYV